MRPNYEVFTRNRIAMRNCGCIFSWLSSRRVSRHNVITVNSYRLPVSNYNSNSYEKHFNINKLKTFEDLLR